MLFSSRNYAIGMAHYQVAGGLRVLLSLVGVYVALTCAIVGFAIYNSDVMGLKRVLMPVATLFMVMEAFGLVALGGIRIAGCIRMDTQTNMLESHRQMPVPAWQAMMGYLVGANTQILAVAALNLVVMAALQAGAGYTMDNFVVGQIVLLGFAGFVWSMSAMGALMFRQAMPLMVMAFFFGSCASIMLRGFGILPGASLLAAPFLGETIFSLSHGAMDMRYAYPAALAAQGAFTVLFFIGACRRYRGTYLTTFNVPMGVALVIVWAGLTAVAIRVWPHVITRFTRDSQPPVADQITAGLTVAALLMIVPLHALSAWESRHRVRPQWRVLALAAGVLAALLVLAGDAFDGGGAALAMLVMTAHALTIYAVLRLSAQAKGVWVATWVILALFVMWVLPVVIEVVRWFFLPENRFGLRVTNMSVISTFSPLGLLAAGLRHHPDGPPLLPGMCFQIAVAAILGVFMYGRRGEAAPVEATSAVTPAETSSATSAASR